MLITIPLWISATEINDEISLALKAGNAKELAVYFNKNIDLNIPENEGIFSKAQAELIMKEFFSNHTSIEFAILHKGSSKDGAKYTIGNLTTKEGTFRAYYYMKANEDSFLIHEFSLNKEEKDR